MKNIFLDVINSGEYDLTHILSKIEEYHLRGKITEEESEELSALARQKPTSQFDIKVEIGRLWTAVRELQQGNKTETTPEEVADWRQPTGAHDGYVNGQRMRYTDGYIYRSIYPGVNVWSPDVLPSAWEREE